MVADFYDALNAEVDDLFQDAARRTQKNDRKNATSNRLRTHLTQGAPSLFKTSIDGNSSLAYFLILIEKLKRR